MKYRNDQPAGDPVAPGHRVPSCLVTIAGLEVRGGDEPAPRARGGASRSNVNANGSRRRRAKAAASS
jgi:hypothetical protein